MYSSVIGYTFLKAYNERESASYSAQEFCEEKLFILVFEEGKNLFRHKNSTFDQGNLKGIKEEGISNHEKHEIRKRILKSKIEEERQYIDDSFVPGYPSSEKNGFPLNSGQITDMRTYPNVQDAYAAWIGTCFNIKLQGDVLLQLNEPQLLLDIYDGIEYYKSYIESPIYKNLQQRQLFTWNNLWLSHKYSRDFIEERPLFGIQEPGPLKGKSILAFNVTSWTKVLLSIARKFNKTVLGYITNRDMKSNVSTIGFVPINLKSFNKVKDFYKNIFGEGDYLKNRNIVDSLFGGDITLNVICQKGEIGIQALKPAGLEKYIWKGTIKHKTNETEQTLSLKVYQTWLTAMLNNTEIAALSEDFADKLHNYAGLSKTKTSTEREKYNAIENLLSVKKYVPAFLDRLATIVDDYPNPPEEFLQVTQAISTQISGQDFHFFTSLTRFHFNYKNQKNRAKTV